MTVPALHIDEERLEEISTIVSTPVTDLVKIYSALELQNGKYLKFGQISKIVSDASSVSDPETFCRTILSLRRFCDQNDIAPNEIVESIRKGLVSVEGGSSLLDKLKNSSDALKSIISSSALHNSYKLIDLIFENDLHVHKLRVISEIRPIFNFERTSLSGVIIMSNLKIDYSDKFENEKTFTVSLKREELELLRTEVERALKKLDVAERDLKAGRELAVIQYSGKVFDGH